jgi:hypothetical protein
MRSDLDYEISEATINRNDYPYSVRAVRGMWSDYKVGKEVAAFRYKTHALMFVEKIWRDNSKNGGPNYVVVYQGRVFGSSMGRAQPIMIDGEATDFNNVITLDAAPERKPRSRRVRLLPRL